MENPSQRYLLNKERQVFGIQFNYSSGKTLVLSERKGQLENPCPNWKERSGKTLVLSERNGQSENPYPNWKERSVIKGFWSYDQGGFLQDINGAIQWRDQIFYKMTKWSSQWPSIPTRHQQSSGVIKICGNRTFVRQEQQDWKTSHCDLHYPRKGRNEQEPTHRKFNYDFKIDKPNTDWTKGKNKFKP